MQWKKQQKNGGTNNKCARALCALLAGAALASGLMLTAPRHVHAEPPKGKIFASLYDKTAAPSVGFGLSKGFGLPLGFSADASMALYSAGGTASLESAELDLTTQFAGAVSGTFYVYNDRFYYVERGYGTMLNYGNLHAAGEYVGNGWGDAFVKYVIRLAGGKARLVPKAIILFSDKKVEGLGTELGCELDIRDVSLFGKVMHSRTLPVGNWMNGNMQAGMSFGF